MVVLVVLVVVIVLVIFDFFQWSFHRLCRGARARRTLARDWRTSICSAASAGFFPVSKQHRIVGAIVLGCPVSVEYRIVERSC